MQRKPSSANCRHVAAFSRSPFNFRSGDGYTTWPIAIPRGHPPPGKCQSPLSAAMCLISHDEYQLHDASPLSSQRLSSRAAATSAASASSFASAQSLTAARPSSATIDSPSSRTSYTGIRHLLSAVDINTDSYPDSSWKPTHLSSIEQLFAEADHGYDCDRADGGDSAPDG
jgi:hypothetical protein